MDDVSVSSIIHTDKCCFKCGKLKTANQLHITPVSKKIRTLKIEHNNRMLSFVNL